MSGTYNSCAVCDGPINAYGAGGALCARCQQPCPTCDGDVAHCPHPLPAEQDNKRQ